MTGLTLSLFFILDGKTMGLFYSRPPCPVHESDIVDVLSSQPKQQHAALDLPVDVYTCILEFLVDMNPNTNANDDTNMDVYTITSFRLINKSTKLAFEKMNGWNMVYNSFQCEVAVLSNKISILSSTIADPPSSITCIMRFDAYLTQCWTLKNEFSLKRNHVQEEVLINIARLADSSNDDMSKSNTNKKKRQQLMLISEWEGDECVLKFEPIRNDELTGFVLPAIDQSELPFMLA